MPLENVYPGLRKEGTLTFRLTVRNNSEKAVYLIVEGKHDLGYNETEKRLSFSLDIQPANFHSFKFPSLKRMKSKSKTELVVKIPISSWKPLESGKFEMIGSGSWSVIASVGILEEKELKTKLKGLGYSSVKDVRISALDFAEMQRVIYSNYVEISFLKE